MTDGELFREYRKTGDPAIRNAIAEKYLYVAKVIAKKFVGRGVEYDDLLQVASLALIKGIDRFDETKGMQFSTFITPTVTGEIKNYFRDRSRLVHLPRKVAELRGAVKRVSDEMFAESGKKPSAGEIALRLGVSEEEVVRAAEAGVVVSLDRPAATEEGGGYYDVIPSDDDSFEKLESHDELRSAVKILNERERELVRCRFGEELSQTETARRMGVSQMYVSRLERKILEKLRERMGEGAV